MKEQPTAPGSPERIAQADWWHVGSMKTGRTVTVIASYILPAPRDEETK